MSPWKTNRPPRSVDNYIVVREVNVTTYRFKPYSPKSQEYKRGQFGRWQKCEGRGDFHDWRNCDPPADAEWMGSDEYYALREAGKLASDLAVYRDRLAAENERLREAALAVLSQEVRPVHVGYDNGSGGGNFVYEDHVSIESEAFNKLRYLLNTEAS